MKNLINKEQNFLIVMVLAAFVLRFIYMLICDNYLHGDTGARLHMAYEWLFSPTILTGYDYLPVYSYLCGAVIYLTDDVVWAPRLMNVVLGTLTVLPFYYVVKELFGDRNARYSVFALVVLGNHVLHSVVTLTEIPFLFMLMMAIFLLQKFFKKQSLTSLAGLVFFLTAINFTRYEGWMYSALFGIAMLLNKLQWRWLVSFSVAVSICPVLYLLFSWYATGDLMHGLNYSDYEVKQTALLAGRTIWDGFPVIHTSFIFFSVLLVPWGAYQSYKHKNRRYYLIFLFIPLLYASYKLLTLTLAPDPRYFLTCAVLALPLWVLIFTETPNRWLTPLNVFPTLVIVVFMLNAVKSWPILINPVQQNGNGKFPEGFMLSAKWASQNLHNHRLFIDNKNLSSYHWKVYARQWLISNDNPTEGVAGIITGRFWLNERFNADSLQQQLLDKRITHLMLFNGGELDTYLKFSEPRETWRRLQFVKLCDFHGYKIYKNER